MRRVYTALISLGCSALGLGQANAITVDEFGAGSGETVAINCPGVGIVFVDAGILQLNAGGAPLDGLRIVPSQLGLALSICALFGLSHKTYRLIPCPT